MLRSKYKVSKWSASCNQEFLPFYLVTVYHNSCYWWVGKDTDLWNLTRVQSDLPSWGLRSHGSEAHGNVVPWGYADPEAFQNMSS